VLLEHIQRHPAEGEACCLALIDIDFFKQINDVYGHLAGDAVLEELARLLMQAVRSQDLVARFGGEEFILLLRAPPRRRPAPSWIAPGADGAAPLSSAPANHRHHQRGPHPYQMSYRAWMTGCCAWISDSTRQSAGTQPYPDEYIAE
jgi:GGDEF domain-containing protein